MLTRTAQLGAKALSAPLYHLLMRPIQLPSPHLHAAGITLCFPPSFTSSHPTRRSHSQSQASKSLRIWTPKEVCLSSPIGSSNKSHHHPHKPSLPLPSPSLQNQNILTLSRLDMSPRYPDASRLSQQLQPQWDSPQRGQISAWVEILSFDVIFVGRGEGLEIFASCLLGIPLCLTLC